MQGGSKSLSDRGACHIALIAFVFAVMGLLCVPSPAGLAGTHDGPSRQIDSRVEQIEALNLPAGPMVSLDIRVSKGPHQEVVELSESVDDDDTEHYLLEVPRFDVVPFGSQTGLYESRADRALTPFLLRAFSTRGSPLA